MGLVTAARFATPAEAQIAAGALRARGVAAEVFDTQLGQTDWAVQYALGGFRLVVPAEDAAEARAFLAEARALTPTEAETMEDAPPVVPWWRRALGALGLILAG